MDVRNTVGSTASVLAASPFKTLTVAVEEAGRDFAVTVAECAAAREVPYGDMEQEFQRRMAAGVSWEEVRRQILFGNEQEVHGDTPDAATLADLNSQLEQMRRRLYALRRDGISLVKTTEDALDLPEEKRALKPKEKR